MPGKKLEPDAIDKRIVYEAGLGYQSKTIARRHGVSTEAIKFRFKRLYPLVGSAGTIANLVYVFLDKDYIEYLRRPGRTKLTPEQIAVVEGVAYGKTRTTIARELQLTVDGVDARIRRARMAVNAKNQAQLVAIAWTEDWIV